MDYELAKELKDAGFPQTEDKYCRCGFLTMEEKDGVPVIYDCKTERVSKPTLSELIEACGGNLHALEQLTNEEEVTGWAAYLRPGTTLPKSCYHGLIPEEAVAHLWFALNKK